VRLTDLTIPKLPTPAKGAKVYSDDTLLGFGVRVTSAGVRAFVWTHGRSRTRETLGRVGIISLKDARQKCRERAAAQTLNQHKAPSLSFEDALAIFETAHLAKNKKRTAEETRRILRRNFLPALRHYPLGDISTHHLTAILDKLSAEQRNSFAAIRLFLNFATRRRYIPHSPLAGLSAPKAGERDRVLSPDELKIVWKATEQLGTFGKLCQLLICTGQRANQIASLHADFIDMDKRLIRWPPVLMKNNRAHQVPFSYLTASILATLPTEGLLFPARGKDTPFNGFSKSTSKLYALCPIPPFTLHTFRRTYATILQSQGVRLEVTERLLSHVSGSLGGIVGLYQRHSYEPEMRQACTLLERYLSDLVGGNGAA
jgi:integrase